MSFTTIAARCAAQKQSSMFDVAPEDFELAAQAQPMTRAQAMDTFRALVARHGLQWTASAPREDYTTLAECNKVLTAADRREALGLRA